MSVKKILKNFKNILVTDDDEPALSFFSLFLKERKLRYHSVREDG
jgi:hypothetical protein